MLSGLFLVFMFYNSKDNMRNTINDAKSTMQNIVENAGYGTKSTSEIQSEIRQHFKDKKSLNQVLNIKRANYESKKRTLANILHG